MGTFDRRLQHLIDGGVMSVSAADGQRDENEKKNDKQMRHAVRVSLEVMAVGVVRLCVDCL
jgi:hypothetical protein